MSRAPLILLGAVLLTTGCPKKSSVNHPEEALRAYARALEREDHNAAYELMSVEFRKTHTRDDFVRMLRAHAADLKRSAAQIKGTPNVVKVQAVVAFGEGDSLRLVLS